MARPPFALALLFLLILPALALGALDPDKDRILALQTPAPTGRIVVKFTAESDLKVSRAGLVGGDPAIEKRIGDLVGRNAGTRLTRRFTRTLAEVEEQRLRAEKRTGRRLPDLNSYGALDFRGRDLSRDELLAIVRAFLEDPAVETAYLEPRSVPAALGFDAFTGQYERPVSATVRSIRPTDVTPDLTEYQYYLGAPPDGVNALAADSIPGARAGGLKLIDVENAWNWTHEDLPAPFDTLDVMSTVQSSRDHGTAVLGEMAARDNGYGVRGITPDLAVGSSSCYYRPVSDAILEAASVLAEGDMILIEQHAPGPLANGSGQFGYLPMEFWQDCFDAIQVSTAAGLVVIEAAGNGTQDLDRAEYGDLFDPDYRDSGAIMCGAAESTGEPYYWSNHGVRVDLNGWGGGVASTGYGNMYCDTECSEDTYYTWTFSGTSSASPIVAGSVAALQGMSRANLGLTLDARLLRQALKITGTPQIGTNLIGPRPDIVAAYARIETGLGEIGGTVTDAATGLPLAGAEVRFSGAYGTIGTDGAGEYSVLTLTGSYDLEFSLFRYETAVLPGAAVYGSPTTLDAALDPLPLTDVVVRVSAKDGADVSSARVTGYGIPVAAQAEAAAGSFRFADVPEGKPFGILVDGVPGHGADFLTDVLPVSRPNGAFYIYPRLEVAHQTFDLWWGNYTALDTLWSWGVPAAGAPAAFSGDKCWGVGMDGGGYPADMLDFLVSDETNLFGHDQVLLSLHYWCDLEENLDGACLEMATGTGFWEKIEPLGGYSHDHVNALEVGAGWSGDSGGWRGAVFDITAYTGQLVQFRIRVASDESVSGAGFFVDDITFDTGEEVAAAPPEVTVPSGRGPTLALHPNPFNPRVTVTWEITRPGDVSLEVYDTRGRHVRTILRGPATATRGTAVWDGTDASGRRVASGAYLVRIREESGKSTTVRATLLK